jgi:hypothetical protein
MNRFAVFTAASLIALSGSAMAEQELTAGQMDAVTAAGSAAAQALATSLGVVVSDVTSTLAQLNTIGEEGPIGGDGQIGFIPVIQSTAMATSQSVADGVAVGIAQSQGTTVGTGLSDTASFSSTIADVPGLFAQATASNQNIASSVIIGLGAASASSSVSAATLAD